MNIAEAQEYLKLIRTLPAERRGPHRFFNHDTDKTRLLELSHKVHTDMDQQGDKLWRATNAWHAAAWLEDITAEIAQCKPESSEVQLYNGFVTNRGAPIFRGQCDYHWKIIPSIRRGKDPAAAWNSLSAFLLAMSCLFNFEELNPTPELHIATAQHYGIATPFLDFTVEPSIAVYFACSANADGMAAVYWLPFYDAVNLGAKVILPPPWVKRLHLQFGLFLDCSNLDTEELKQQCHTVLFRANPSFQEDYIEQTGYHPLPEDKWFADAADWANGNTHKLEPLSRMTAARLAVSLRRQIGSPPFQFDALIPARMLGWEKLLFNMLEWLAFKVFDQQQPAIDCYIVKLLARDNPGLAITLRYSRKLIGQLYETEQIVKHDLAELLRAAADCLDMS